MADMLNGGIAGSIAAFSVPLILGNMFQLTYEAVDSMIVGRFAGDIALAAVGTAAPVMNFLIMFLNGLCMGASVLMSNYFGRKNLAALKKAMANLLILGMILSVLILGAGLGFSKPAFIAMRVPDIVMDDALSYIRVILAGMPFTCFYNIYAAALRSIGDSRTPLIFLAVSSVINVILDVLFVAVMGYGVAGAAAATDIATFLSAAACAVYTYKKIEPLRLEKSSMQIDPVMMKQTIRYGSTTALQQCSQPLGKLAIQGMVNTLGVTVMAAFNIVGKIEDFALVPERSIASAMMTFTAQNDGAGKEERVRRGLKKGMMVEFSYFIFICLVILLFKRPMLSLFTTEPATLDEGERYFRVMAFFYCLSAATNGIQGFFRGMKHMKMSLVLTIIQISVRVLVTYLVIDSLGIEGIAYACAAGWTAMLIVSGVYFHKLLKSGRAYKS